MKQIKKQKFLLQVVLIFSLACTFSTLNAQSQLIEPTYFSISEGLVSPTVNAVIQDNYGIIWIGTTNGLQMYDGYKFQTFKNVPGKPTSLQNNLVWSLLEDANHDLWVSNGKGVSKYNRQKNEFKNYEFAPAFNFTRESQVAGFKLYIDSQKRLWVNTLNVQLLKYDEATDTWKYAKYELPNSAKPDQVGPSLAIIEDLNGGLWMGSPNYGLMHLPKNKAAFKPVPIEKTGGFDFIKTENNITALFADASNTLWITTRNGVYKYNPSSGTFKIIKEYNEDQLNGWNQWNSILKDPEGNIWIANNYRGILKFGGITDRYEEISIAGKVKMSGHGYIYTLTQFMIDRSGIFWFGSREFGLLKYNPVNKPFSFYAHDDTNPRSISPNGVYGILASRVKPGVVYVGTRGNGINILDPKKQTFEKITFKAAGDQFGGSARSISEADDGSLWLGTWGDGLIKLDKNYKEVKRYKYEPKNSNSISNNQVRVIKPDKQGRLWIGTNSGLNIFDPQSGKFQRVSSKLTRNYPNHLVTEMERLILSNQKVGIIDQVVDNQILSVPVEIKIAGTYLVMAVGEGTDGSMADYGWIENDAKDTVWRFNLDRSFYAGGAGKNRVVIESLTLQPGKYTLHYKTDDSHSYGKWNEPGPDQTSLYGIALVKPENQNQLQSFQAPLTQQKEELTISGTNIFDIEIDDKYAWVSSSGDGLNKIDITTNKVTEYKNDPANENSPSSNVIQDIFKDSRGIIWLATTEGINKFNPNTKTFTRYTETDGLPTNLMMAIQEGDNGEMWFASQNGLTQMVTNEALGKVTFINYNSSDGLGGETFLNLTSARAADGRFYFGGDHGLTTFSSISANKTPPALIISNLFIANKSVLEMGDESPLKTSLLDAKEITLSYQQNSLSFEFSALHYANPQKNQYAHMLKGYDKDWIYDNRNFAAYTNLDPGKYEFIVRAANAYGIWNEEGKSLQIIILPPWWRTWWAYAAYILAFGLVIYSTDRFMRRRIKLRERERSREKELEQAKEIEKAYTELKATQSQLIQSEKMASLGELTAGIAHEIQNPLNFVNNFSEVNTELIDEMNAELDKGDINEAKAIAIDIKQNLEKINHHGKRADAIVKGMLQHSRSSNGVKEPTDINALADEYLRLAYHGLRAKDKSFNATMKTDFDASIGKIDVTPQDIGRVILNLITNAFYAVNEKKQLNIPGYEPIVSVSTSRSLSSGNGRGEIEIKVIDNGNGIPQKVLDKIFQPFFTTKPAGQGTGLGLSMSYDIIKVHGGELKVQTKEGEATEFIIRLPYLQ